ANREPFPPHSHGKPLLGAMSPGVPSGAIVDAPLVTAYLQGGRSRVCPGTWRTEVGVRSTGDGMAAGDSPPPGGSTSPSPGESAAAGSQDLIGYRGPTACSAAGITYRQLDYWARTGF